MAASTVPASARATSAMDSRERTSASRLKSEAVAASATRSVMRLTPSSWRSPHSPCWLRRKPAFSPQYLHLPNVAVLSLSFSDVPGRSYRAADSISPAGTRASP
ncbi:MAG: hypothetical protein F4Y49_08740 [Dehalococcoidia bacterium]|nr:hypothetical protein [Dehalococcoidia bacterium]